MSIEVSNWEEGGNKHIDLAQERRALPYHSHIAKLVVQYSEEGDSVLDIGCGIGVLATEISTLANRDLHVSDAYQECLNATLDSLPTATSYLLSEAEFDVADVVKQKFDVVVMSHVLEHTLSPYEAAKSAMSLVKEGGVLVLAVPNPVRPGVIASNLRQTHYVNRGHVVCWDMSHWRNFVENILQFDVVTYSHDFIPLPGWRRFKLVQNVGESLCRKWFPWFSFSNIVVCTHKVN